jgi:4-hydroxybenzoate polyprenyltransferase
MTKTTSTSLRKIISPYLVTSADIKAFCLFVCNYNAIVVMWSLNGAICSQRIARRQNSTLDGSGSIPFSLAEVLNVGRTFLLPFTFISLVTITFCISNQRRPVSIQEDSLNKPWRPIPSGLISPERASVFFIIFNIIGLVFSWSVNSTVYYLLAQFASYLYNERGASDGHYAFRDFLNGIGLAIWTLGATSAAKGPNLAFANADIIAGAIMAFAIATTDGIQDLRDLYGDRQCGRRTFPLLVGEMNARYLLALATLLWSFGLIPFLDLPLLSAQTVLGAIIAVRLVLLRECDSDKMTTQIWFAWSASLPFTLIT